MPIHLEPPSHNPRGPDGKGWNRLSLDAHMGTGGSKCALRPRSYEALWTSKRNTMHARWVDDYAPCVGKGLCDECPIFNAAKIEAEAFTDDVLVRIREVGEPSDLIPGGVRSDLWLMNRPEHGWASSGRRYTWDNFFRIAGWRIGRKFRDVNSGGFWIHREQPQKGVA